MRLLERRQRLKAESHPADLFIGGLF